MRILYLEMIETCVEAKSAYDIFFTDIIKQGFVEKFSDLGKIIIKSNLDKPFFKVIVRGKYTIKGIIGNDNFRVLMADNSGIEELNELKYIINDLLR
ncbi:MAG TPA: hypothetical protein PLE30_09265 [Candidatus Kapabacteria bacterium]|nr:hypothetical protein [Candidatus Kapabacteria bacterium]